MRIAILDPFSGIAGDMTLGALVDAGLDPEWLRGLPALLRLDGVSVEIRDVRRGGLACKKVSFAIPKQPHGRHLRQIREMVHASAAPDAVRARADAAFTALAVAEGEMHGVPPDEVHLHEVGAVDAILDVLGAIWGLELLGVQRVYSETISAGDGFVRAAHGLLPVPAPATLKLLEGHRLRPGPDGSGELVTPTGAALVRGLSAGPPGDYIPVRSGYGAGDRDFPDRANVLRIILAEEAPTGATLDRLVMLAADIDDMTGEYLAGLADGLREAGALDVVLTPTLMKKGRPGARIEVLAPPLLASALEERLLLESTTLGVRRTMVERRVLPRHIRTVRVLDHDVAVKLVQLPGGELRGKPEFEDVRRVALATRRPLRDIFELTEQALKRSGPDGV